MSPRDRKQKKAKKKGGKKGKLVITDDAKGITSPDVRNCQFE